MLYTFRLTVYQLEAISLLIEHGNLTPASEQQLEKLQPLYNFLEDALASPGLRSCDLIPQVKE